MIEVYGTSTQRNLSLEGGQHVGSTLQTQLSGATHWRTSSCFISGPPKEFGNIMHPLTHFKIGVHSIKV